MVEIAGRVVLDEVRRYELEPRVGRASPDRGGAPAS
jgi:hypothetical protein